MIKFLVLLFVTAVAVNTVNGAAPLVSCTPGTHIARLPPFYDSSVEPLPAHMVNTTGMVAVITGCSSETSELVPGQAGIQAHLMATEENWLVICIARHPKPSWAGWQYHIRFDLRDKGKMDNFVNVILPNILTSAGKSKRVHYLGLIHGQMQWVYAQDNNWETEEAMIYNNYGTHRRLEDLLRRNNFIKKTGYSRIDWGISTASFGPTGNTPAYEQAKTLMTNRVKQATREDRELGYEIVSTGVHPDAVANTSITCDTDIPIINTEVCFNYRLFCPFDGAFFPGYTMAIDVARMRMALAHTKPQYLPNVMFVIDGPTPMDAYGGNWADKWARWYYEVDARCFADAWIANFGRKAAHCDADEAKC